MPAGKPGELSETINSNTPASQAVAVFRISRDLCNPRVCLLITQALRSRVSFTSPMAASGRIKVSTATVIISQPSSE